MTRVLCPQSNCVFWDGGGCGADEISLDSEQLSCVTMEDIKELILDGEELVGEWEEDDDDVDGDEDDWEDEAYDDDDDDAWEPY